MITREKNNAVSFILIFIGFATLAALPPFIKPFIGK
jgi:hypothetical protein